MENDIILIYLAAFKFLGISWIFVQIEKETIACVQNVRKQTTFKTRTIKKQENNIVPKIWSSSFDRTNKLNKRIPIIKRF